MTRPTDAPPAPAPSGPVSWRSIFSGGRGLYVAMLNLGIGLHAVDVFVVSTVMPDVVRDLGGAHFYAWSTMLYMVASIVGAAATAPLRRARGGREAYCIGGILFLMGSILCALAPSMILFVLARAVQGFGGGIVLARSMAMVGELFPEAMKKPVLALVSSTWGIAALLGPALGGSFAALDFWRGAFWFNLPFGIIFVAAALLRLPADRPERGSSFSFPYRRMIMLTAGVLCVGTASEGGSALARGGLIALALLLVYGTFMLDRAGENRLFPSRPLSLRTTTGAGYWAMFLFSMTHTLIGVFMPLAFQVLKGESPLAAGYMMAVLAIAWTAASLVTARWQGRAVQAAMLGGSALCVFGLAALALGVETQPAWVLTALNALVGLGLGSCNLHVVAATMRHAAPGEESITASSVPTIRSLGIAFGAAAAGAIANSVGLTDDLHAADVARAVGWVLGLGTLAPLCGFFFVFRFIALLHRNRNQPPAA